MTEPEELLATALGYLKEASESQDFAVRATLLDLAYRFQQLAQAAILRESGQSGAEPPDQGISFA